MPFICPATGEMAIDGLQGADVTVETSPKTLISHSVVKAKSGATGKIEKWIWKEEKDLDIAEIALFRRLKEAKKEQKS